MLLGWPATLAALYAIEAAQPAIAETKRFLEANWRLLDDVQALSAQPPSARAD